MRPRTLSPRSRRAWGPRSGRAVAGARPSSAARRRGRSTRRCGRCRRGPGLPRAGDASACATARSPTSRLGAAERRAAPPRTTRACRVASGRAGRRCREASERRSAPRGSPDGVEPVAEAGQHLAPAHPGEQRGRGRARAGRASATSAWTRMLSAPCRGPLKVASAARRQASRSAPVEAATRAAKDGGVELVVGAEHQRGLEQPDPARAAPRARAGGRRDVRARRARPRAGVRRRRRARPTSVQTSSAGAGSLRRPTRWLRAAGRPDRSRRRSRTGTGEAQRGEAGEQRVDGVARRPGGCRRGARAGAARSGGVRGQGPGPEQLGHGLEAGRARELHHAGGRGTQGPSGRISVSAELSTGSPQRSAPAATASWPSRASARWRSRSRSSRR